MTWVAACDERLAPRGGRHLALPTGLPKNRREAVAKLRRLELKGVRIDAPERPQTTLPI